MVGVRTPSAKKEKSARRKPKYPKGYIAPVRPVRPVRPTPSRAALFVTQRPLEQWTSFVQPKWCILPRSCFTSPSNRFAFEFGETGFREQYIKSQVRPCPFRPTSTGTPFETQWNAMRLELLELYYLNQKVRFAFKRLLNAYLSRTILFRNDVDPVTLERPVQEIVVFDWKSRSKYRFEAKSLAVDMRTRMLTHEDMFPMPAFPRNPYTNSRFSLGQLCSIFQSLKTFGKTDWLLEAYRDARFDLHLFTRDNQRKLRLCALKDLLQTSECRYLLLDFIRAQHIALEKYCDAIVYEWAITYSHDIKRIESWKEYCYKFYEIEITVEDIEDRIHRQTVLTRHIEPLCTPCEELKKIRQLLRTKRRQA